MSAVAVAIGAGSLISGYMGSQATSGAAETAAGYQLQGVQLGTEEMRREFDALQALLAPYVQAGMGSLEEQQNMLGLNGPEAQAAAMKAIESSPEFAAITAQGENAILQGASATGGLRGGNVQGALSQFRPQVLSELIQQRFQNLGSLTNIGQASAAGVGAGAMNTGAGISSLIQQGAAARAGSALAAGQAQSQLWGGIGQTATQLGTMYMGGAF